MAKITSRRLDGLEQGVDILVNFTRVQGRNGGALVQHSGTILSVCPESEVVQYATDDQSFTFKLGSKYVQHNGTVVGRDARAKVEG
jgi:hypothetical protein